MKKVFIFYAITLTTCLSIQSDEIIRKPKKQKKCMCGLYKQNFLFETFPGFLLR